MSELLAVPRMGIGNRQLSPDATLMSPVEFSPQSANPTSFGHSGAASAEDADIELDAPTIITKPATLDNRIVDFLALMHTHCTNFYHRRCDLCFGGSVPVI